jgi:8-oxo-dGTP pyrophosphatase MutT (NUDIX family)
VTAAESVNTTDHPGLAAAMRAGGPVATSETVWAEGTMPLRVSAYTTTPDLPLELISSVRCIVYVDGDRIVFCENADGRHPWPGGRRNPGESFADTAAREVHEETGWLIERESLRPRGWLRFTHLGPEPAANQGPYPDFLQVVFTATATTRDGGRDVQWTDMDGGYEHTSSLLTLTEARRLTSTNLLAHVFLDLLLT